MDREIEKGKFEEIFDAAKMLEKAGANGPQIARHLKEQKIDIKEASQILFSMRYMTNVHKDKLSVSIGHETGLAPAHPNVEIVSWEEEE
jgi:hypothetical protein